MEGLFGDDDGILFTENPFYYISHSQEKLNVNSEPRNRKSTSKSTKSGSLDIVFKQPVNAPPRS